jgi:hypothetical protein
MPCFPGANLCPGVDVWTVRHVVNDDGAFRPPRHHQLAVGLPAWQGALMELIKVPEVLSIVDRTHRWTRTLSPLSSVGRTEV